MWLLFSKRKTLILNEGSELSVKVKQVEDFLNEPFTIWDDEERYETLQRLNNLSLEERRLYIVFSLLDCSLNKVAELFCVDRKTIETRIEEIKKKIYD